MCLVFQHTTSSESTQSRSSLPISLTLSPFFNFHAKYPCWAHCKVCRLIASNSKVNSSSSNNNIKTKQMPSRHLHHRMARTSPFLVYCISFSQSGDVTSAIETSGRSRERKCGSVLRFSIHFVARAQSHNAPGQNCATRRRKTVL